MVPCSPPAQSPESTTPMRNCGAVPLSPCMRRLSLHRDSARAERSKEQQASTCQWHAVCPLHLACVTQGLHVASLEGRCPGTISSFSDAKQLGQAADMHEQGSKYWPLKGHMK